MNRPILAAATLAISTAVAAQPPAPPPPAAPSAMAGAPDPARFEQAVAAMRARRADDIAIVLGLKPAQRPALDQWLAAQGPRPGMRGHHGRDEGGAPETTADRLDRRQARLAERQARENEGIAATRKFYATLDAQQRRVFDALERLRHGDGPRGFGRGHDAPPPPPGK